MDKQQTVNASITTMNKVVAKAVGIGLPAALLTVSVAIAGGGAANSVGEFSVGAATAQDAADAVERVVDTQQGHDLEAKPDLMACFVPVALTDGCAPVLDDDSLDN